jgi:hypothetical protein
MTVGDGTSSHYLGVGTDAADRGSSATQTDTTGSRIKHHIYWAPKLYACMTSFPPLVYLLLPLDVD